MEPTLSASLLTQSGGRQHNEADLSNINDWVDGSSGDLACGLKIGCRAGSHRFVEAECLSIKRRAEPTALRSLERFENDKDALLALAKTNFKGLTWAEPGVNWTLD